MPVWVVTCPNCETRNDVAAETVLVKCGRVTHHGRCANCDEALDAEQPYWRWLGLDHAPPAKAGRTR